MKGHEDGGIYLENRRKLFREQAPALSAKILERR
jgi:hypothetical protein